MENVLGPGITHSVTGPDGQMPGTFALESSAQLHTFTLHAMLVPGITYTVPVSDALLVGVPASRLEAFVK